MTLTVIVALLLLLVAAVTWLVHRDRRRAWAERDSLAIIVEYQWRIIRAHRLGVPDDSGRPNDSRQTG